VPETLLNFFYILDTSNKHIVLVQLFVAGSIKLLHDLCHPAVLAGSAMTIGQLVIRTPASGTRSHRAETVDGDLSTVHAE
jgi:hypothetical protein